MEEDQTIHSQANERRKNSLRVYRQIKISTQRRIESKWNLKISISSCSTRLQCLTLRLSKSRRRL